MATPKTVSFHTLGCKLNFAESSALGQLFENQGFSLVNTDTIADIYVINTCSVTDFADQKCRQAVRKMTRLNPDAHIVVTGCFAQLKPDEIAAIPGVDLVLGAAEKFRMLDYIGLLAQGDGGCRVFAGDVAQASTFQSSFSFGDRTRSFLKVQDGCDYKCTFCTIPQARGASRSGTIPEIVRQANELAKNGAKEIVLTGVNIGDFGNGTAVIEGRSPRKEALFIDLIKELDKSTDIPRFRISSIEPNLCTKEIIEFVASSRAFMPHFHMPLQSGSNRILNLMRRRYLRELYSERVEWIRKVMPYACIGVDVITGFPGESEADFKETVEFVRELPVDYLHVFTYSERANTPAISFSDSVPMHIRRERNAVLREISERKSFLHYTKYIHTTRPVLIEKSKKKGFWTGFTDNYIQVFIPEETAKLNEIMPVDLLQFDDQMQMIGQICTLKDELLHV